VKTKITLHRRTRKAQGGGTHTRRLSANDDHAMRTKSRSPRTRRSDASSWVVSACAYKALCSSLRWRFFSISFDARDAAARPPQPHLLRARRWLVGFGRPSAEPAATLQKPAPPPPTPPPPPTSSSLLLFFLLVR